MEEVLLCIAVMGTMFLIWGITFGIAKLIEYKNEKEFEKRVAQEMDMRRREAAYAAEYCDPVEFDIKDYKTLTFDKLKDIFTLSNNQYLEENWKDYLGAKVLIPNSYTYPHSPYVDEYGNHKCLMATANYEIPLKIVHIEGRKIYAIITNNKFKINNLYTRGYYDIEIPENVKEYMVPMIYSNNIINNNSKTELIRGITLGDLDETVVVKSGGKDVTLRDNINKPFQFFDRSLIDERTHLRRINSLRNSIRCNNECDPSDTGLIKLDSIVKYNSGKSLTVYLRAIKKYYRYKIKDKPYEIKGFQYTVAYKEVESAPKLNVICFDFSKIRRYSK